jgi:hypothetical protein
MNNRILSLVFAIAISCLSVGCSQTSTTFSDPLSEVNQDHQRDHNKELEQYQTADFRWLQYANPRADASFAIEKQDFTLLAFAGRATSFPGIGNESSTLQQQCGYRLLANSGDALRSKEQLNLRKQLYQYAATFNQLVAAACQKNNYQNKAVP